MGSIGVTGSSAANALAQDADVVLAIGTRLQDFTTGSRALFRNPERKIINLNTQVFDAGKHGGIPLVTDARAGIARARQGAGRLVGAGRAGGRRRRRCARPGPASMRRRRRRPIAACPPTAR